MRIIAGEFRGRRLLAPVNEATRPITDRVKQSLFDILAPHIEDARVYDCFAGTGSMGLECLSRGAAHVTFFEINRSAVARLKENIQTLGLNARSAVISSDIFRWFRDTPNPHERGDLFFLDPPYRFLSERAAQLQALVKAMATGHMNANARMIFRHDITDILDFPPLIVGDMRTYGSMKLEFLHLSCGK